MLDIRKNSVFCITALIVSGCTCPNLPDLVVSESVLETNGNESTMNFKIKNIGSASSSESRVYVNAINPTPPDGANEIRRQNHVELVPIEPGRETEWLLSSFNADQLESLGVGLIRLLVDPKDEVREQSESNNTLQVDWP